MKTIHLDLSSFKEIVQEKKKKSQENWLKQRKANEYKIFTKTPKEGQYLFDLEKDAIAYFPDPAKSEAQKRHFKKYVTKGLSFPHVEDTEFTTLGDALDITPRIHLTTQIKGIDPKAPTRIYSNHPEILAIPKIGAKKPKFQLHALDYLRDEGYRVSDFHACQPWESENLPPLILTKYSHFALAELLMSCHGEFRKAVLHKVKQQKITMMRRMFGQTKTKTGTRDFVDFDWKVKINGYWFKIRIRWIDTCALHGVASYEGISSASGTKLPYKKILDGLICKETGRKLTKADMLIIAIQYPELFVKYAIGDLLVYDILVNNAKMMKKVYEGMGVEMKKAPKLTIGGTVKDLFETVLENALLKNLSEKEQNEHDATIKQIINNFVSEATANNLKLNCRDTKALLAKVEGGRCRNHQPLMIFKAGKWVLWIDIDIKGCYGEGQRNQLYPIGNPVIHSYPFNKAKNEYLTLRKWLKMMKWGTKDNDLIAGAWFARVSSIGLLKYCQDFFASWFLKSGTGVEILAKYVRNEKQCNSEKFDLEDTYLDTDDGQLKIFENEIHNAVLTHDGLQWILNIASKRQRNELLDNLLIVASMHYPASQRMEFSENSVLELIAKYKNWDGVNQSYYHVKSGKTTRVEHQPHVWIGLKLDETITDKLLENRGIAKFKHGKKSPLEQMYKLCTNTLFGDFVSKFFDISNTCVGNNITARARALAWYMEKGLYGVQSITDGCGFNPNKVLFPGRDQINGECVSMHRTKDFKNGYLRLDGLGNSKWNGDENGIYRDGRLVGKWKEIDNDGKPEWQYIDIDNEIANLAMEHLQQLFPNVDVLHAPTESLDVVDGEIVRTPRIGQFSFELKDVYKSITSHGSANYKFTSFSPNKPVYKTRGYEGKKQHVGLIEDEQTIDRYSELAPIKDFLNQLETNPEAVTRQNVALKQGILKIGEYLASEERYDALGLVPGDNIGKALLVTEFSLSQFTFKTHKQFSMWEKEVEKLKDKTGQSLEVFFLTQNGTLNYVEMISVIDKMIADDILNPIKYLDEHRNLHREDNHPAKEVLEVFKKRTPRNKAQIDIPQSQIPEEPEEDMPQISFKDAKLVTDDDFDDLFGFSANDTSQSHIPEEPTVDIPQVSFKDVKLVTGDDFDDLFGFS